MTPSVAVTLVTAPVVTLAVLVALVRATVGSRRRFRPLCDGGGGDGLSGREGRRRLDVDGGGGWWWWPLMAACGGGAKRRRRGGMVVVRDKEAAVTTFVDQQTKSRDITWSRD